MRRNTSLRLQRGMAAPSHTMQGSGPGPLSPSGGHPVPPGGFAPRPAIVCGAGPVGVASGPFCPLRVPPCAGAPAPARGRCGAARPPPPRGAVPAPCALGPVGPPRPRPPGLPPRLSRSALCAAARLLRRSLAPSACGPALAALRPSCSVGLAPRGLGPCAARGPAGAPPPRPLRGFGGGWLPPRGPARPSGPLVWGPWPPGLLAARARLRALAALLRVLRPALLGLAALRPGALPGFSLLPPRPCRPAGAPGERKARKGGVAPRCKGCVSRRPCAGPPAGPCGPRCRFFGPVDKPKIVNRPLTSASVCAIFDLARPVALLFWGCPLILRGIHARQEAPSTARPRGLFLQQASLWRCPLGPALLVPSPPNATKPLLFCCVHRAFYLTTFPVAL